VVRTVTLLRYLSEPTLREHITAVTNRTESFHNYANWLMIGGRLIGHNDPDYQERVVKFNELVANAAIYSTALDITDAANALAAEGHRSTPTTWPRSPRTSPARSAASETGSWTSSRPTTAPSRASTCNRASCSRRKGPSAPERVPSRQVADRKCRD
jgi:Tn3 transposase DDE domain